MDSETIKQQARLAVLYEIDNGPDDDHVAKRLRHIAIAEACLGAEMFMGKPDRWYDKPHWRCTNGHVSTMYIKTDLGARCPAQCESFVWLTFPEDKEGPLVDPHEKKEEDKKPPASDTKRNLLTVDIDGPITVAHWDTTKDLLTAMAVTAGSIMSDHEISEDIRMKAAALMSAIHFPDIAVRQLESKAKDDARAWELFQEFWSKAIGSQGYSAVKWKELERFFIRNDIAPDTHTEESRG